MISLTFTGCSSFEIKANDTADAVVFLISNFPTLEQEMASQYYQVSVNNVQIDETELHDPVGLAEIKIIPVIAGSGRGFGKIVLGAALIGGAFLFSPLTFANFGTTAVGFGSAAGIATSSHASRPDFPSRDANHANVKFICRFCVVLLVHLSETCH